MATIFMARLIDHEETWKYTNIEIYKWKWVVLGALGCMNNEDLKKIIK